jgi:hypothetical protein
MNYEYMKTHEVLHQQIDALEAEKKRLENKIRAISLALKIAQPVMDAFACCHELERWHELCHGVFGTAYPASGNGEGEL